MNVFSCNVIMTFNGVLNRRTVAFQRNIENDKCRKTLMTSPLRKRSRSEGDACSSNVMSAMKRSRSDSRVNLNEIYRLLSRTILAYQVTLYCLG